MPTEERVCFIIGPMGDADLAPNTRLQLFARNVVEPILLDIERRDNIRYRVQTPYELSNGHIMNNVIYAIDRAHIIIADITDSNANVFYELGICHALGRATIAVMDKKQRDVKFDLAAYRAYRISFDQYAEARDILRQPLEDAHRDVANGDVMPNPVIDFFRVPVTYLSPAFGLAQGYYRNFVQPVVESLISMRGTNFNYDVGITQPTQPRPRKLEETTLLPAEARNRLELHIVIPSSIAYFKHTYVDKFRTNLPFAYVEGNGRDYVCYYRTYENESRHILVDIPTTAIVMEDGIRRRIPDHRQNTEEWRVIEKQEIDRFVVVLQNAIRHHPDNPRFARRVKIVSYDVERHDPAWLDRILRADEDG